MAVVVVDNVVSTLIVQRLSTAAYARYMVLSAQNAKYLVALLKYPDLVSVLTMYQTVSMMAAKIKLFVMVCVLGMVVGGDAKSHNVRIEQEPTISVTTMARNAK
jgi:hypothetical protein